MKAPHYWPGDSWIPLMASNARRISVLWRHHNIDFKCITAGMNQHALEDSSEPSPYNVCCCCDGIHRQAIGSHFDNYYWPNYFELQYDCVWNSMYAHRKFSISRVGVYTFRNADNLNQRCQSYSYLMMTSSNGNIVRVTGPLWGESTGWIPLTKASGAELWCFLWSAPE